MSTIAINGTTISYQLYWKEGTTLLFIHGSFIDQGFWQDQVDFFSPHNQVVTLDLAGHGLSARTGDDWSAQRFAADLIEFITQLDLNHIILIGHSFGAAIGLLVATHIPGRIAGFIAIDYFKNAATPPPPELEGQKKELLANLQKDLAGTNEKYVRKVLVTPATPPAITDRVVKAYRSAYKPLAEVNVPELFEIHKTEAELLPQLDLKLYLVNVDYQPTNPSALKKALVKGFELTEIHGTSHFPMIEVPERLNEALAGIVRKITTANN